MPSDFYYKDLPTFYPPLYYFLQSLYARIFSVEAYKMAKIGQMLIFALLPFILFYFWRRIVTPLQAGLITLFAFLYSNYAGSLQYFSPHSFVAYALFIPWWLFYIERITKPVATWKFYISGGIIGALLFATYFYAFFIGAVWLFLRFTYVQLSRRRSRPGGYSLAGALRVLAASALFSAPYWLPVIFSIVKNGIDRSRGGWYHIGYPGIDFQFIIFSFEGLALLIGIIFIFRRVQRPLNLSLAVFVLTVLIIHFLGSLSGALGISINLAKSTDLFTHQLAAPIIGLWLTGLYRKEKLFHSTIRVTPILICALLLVFMNNLSGIAKSDATKKARTADVPNWNTDYEEMQARKGSVFLNGNYEFQSFYPVYSFLTLNELYSHPASRYFQRYEFLYHLQSIKDPYLFNLFLQHNIFDKVDFFMPQNIDGKVGVRAAFSNYPNKGYIKTLRFEPGCIKDTALFTKVTGDNLYEVRAWSGSYLNKAGANRFGSQSDSLVYLAHVKELSKMLNPDAGNLMESYTGLDLTNWKSVIMEKAGHHFSDSVILSECLLVNSPDSIYFIYKFECREDLIGQYKIYLHLFDSTGTRHNFDFAAHPGTDNWKKWDFVILAKSVPNNWASFRFSTGLYNRDKQLGETLNGVWSATN